MAATECIIQRTAGYTVMSNYHLRDKGLSLKAKGLLSVILSLPEDWDYTIAGLAKICDCGKDAIRTAVGELEKAGYISRSQDNQDGKFGGNQYIIRETPAEVRSPLSGFPTTESPPTENPLTENPTQLITKESITDGINTPPAAPAESAPKKTRRKKADPEDLLDDGQMRNLLIAQTDELGKAHGLDPAQKNRIFQLAMHWYTPRTLKGEHATPPLHTKLGVSRLFEKLGRGIKAIGADPAIEVFYDSLCKGYTDIYDERFKVGWQPHNQAAPLPDPSGEGAYRCL